MEDILRPIYQERASNPNTLGIIIMEKKEEISPETDNFDIILLVIVANTEQKWVVKHYEYGEKSAALHIIKQEVLEDWINTSRYRKAMEWIINGKIIYDRNQYLDKLKETLRVFPKEQRKRKLAIEFSKLTRNYSEGKNLYQSDDYLDSYSRMLRSLHYLARISIIDKGYHPEVMVWKQVKRIDPQIYKLYEELIRSKEDIKKKVELMLIAIEFSINKIIDICSDHLLEVMRCRNEPWGYGELKVHPEIEAYMYDLVSVMEYLIASGKIEVILEDTKSNAIFHRKYKVNN
ncbi:Nucleotidyltransferase-like [Gracilibacillus ureilyticus]|uniref:Nucleotidyltransferase-like n=1 Tax=Gracilibacillus ureilyticus TaxID=531814 RepID=A0A1H9QEP4_9BACI|nr:nucleotidyltransferase-like protein [Gracilibacillus ureilyticus]SER59016.1 Nucleotidyltransferase-like [Gracilibacillus ureilyticus]